MIPLPFLFAAAGLLLAAAIGTTTWLIDPDLDVLDVVAIGTVSLVVGPLLILWAVR